MRLLTRPEVLGGITLGVLSALPVVGAFNCCCAWMLLGGVVAAQQQQEQQLSPLSTSQGAAVGFRAGVLGALIWVVLSWPVGLMLRPVIQRYVDQALARRDLPPDVQKVLTSLGSDTPWEMVFLGNILLLIMCSAMASLGGLFGALYFRKSAPPPPPPPPVSDWASPPLPPLDPPPGTPEP